MDLLDQHSPEVDRQEIFTDFTERSTKMARRLVRLASQALAVINATYYANNTIKNTLGAEDTNFDFNDMKNEIARVLRIKIAHMVCREFKVDRNYEKHVIYNIIEKEFQAQARRVGIINAPQPPGRTRAIRSEEKSKKGSFKTT